MDRQGLDATVLQLFGQLRNNQLFAVPAQTGLYGDGQLDGIHHFLCDLQHLGDVLQHACTSTLASHLLHRTAEVQVNDIGASLFYDLRGLHHRLHVATVDLDAHRTFLVADGQLGDGGFYIADQRLSTHELRIDHRCSEPLAQQSEADVCHVLHGGQEHRPFTEFYITDLHFACKSTIFS